LARRPSPAPRPLQCPAQRPAPRPSRANPLRVDRHCHWACSTNSRFQTFSSMISTTNPALALAMDKIKTFTMNTFTLPFFAAPSTSTATSCAKSFTCAFHVSPKKTRVFGVGSELADGDGGNKYLPTRPPPSVRVLGVSPMGSVGAVCVCWACLKIGRGSVCLKRPMSFWWRQTNLCVLVLKMAYLEVK